MNSNREIIYFVTGNQYKFDEIAKLFEKVEYKYYLERKDLPMVEIQAETLKEVAIFKLQSIKEDIQGSYFIEDAGFFVDVPLNGFPGIYSKYVLHSIGNEGILRLINDFDAARAHFESVIALYHRSLDKILIFEGRVEGIVSPVKKGDHGFGFDPIFIPNEMPYKTFAELTTNEKNQISHRAKAWNQLISYLKDT
jgi:XTP/dITP diphosphohydrolase